MAKAAQARLRFYPFARLSRSVLDPLPPGSPSAAWLHDKPPPEPLGLSPSPSCQRSGSAAPIGMASRLWQ